MRLLHTTSYQLESFPGAVPPYAILSHVWGLEEVTFKDLDSPSREQLAGWAKVVNCCKRAADDGWIWCWIDTCCIDKSNPTELGEAINSMFRWYEEAAICYAFLADVPRMILFEAEPVIADCPFWWHFRSSRWFRRGWTLQELLAPTFLLFMDECWEDIGSRDECAPEIELATGIRSSQLSDFRGCSVATKISWAAHRETTRLEDRAYSLLGLLGVNLPLIYGEGDKAFIRLQHELIRNYDDESIFAWGDKPGQGHVLSTGSQAGVLATSPEDFKHSNGIHARSFDVRRRGYTMNNAGLSINTEVFEYPGRWSGDIPIYAIKLNCTSQPHGRRADPVVLFLHSKDTELVVFERAGRIFRNWNDVSSISWKALGRKNIVVSHRMRKQNRRQAVTQRVKIRVPYGVVYREPYLATFDHGTGELEPRGSQERGHISLKDDSSIGVITCWINDADTGGDTFYVFVKRAPNAPQFGVFSGKSSFTDLLDLQHNLIAKPHILPTRLNTSCNQTVRLSIRPFQTDGTPSGEDDEMAKTFLLEFQICPLRLPHSATNAIIGRFQNLRQNWEFTQQQDEDNADSRGERLTLDELFDESLIFSRPREPHRITSATLGRVRENLTSLGVLLIALGVARQYTGWVERWSRHSQAQKTLNGWSGLYLEISDVELRVFQLSFEQPMFFIALINAEAGMGMKGEHVDFHRAKTELQFSIHSLGVVLWSLGQRKLVELSYPMAQDDMSGLGYLSDEYDNIVRELIMVEGDCKTTSLNDVEAVIDGLEALHQTAQASELASGPYFEGLSK